MPENAIPRQKIAASGLLTVVLCGLAIFLLLAALAHFQGALRGNAGTGRLLVLILGSRIDSRILTGITAVLAIGSSYVAGGALPDRLYYVIVGLCAFTILMCLILLVVLSDDAVARDLYNFGSQRIADADSFRDATNWALGGTCAWLVGVLVVQVGLHASDNKEQGK